MTVVDASAVVELLLRTAVGEKCITRLLESDQELCAPYLLDIEVAQVLRRYALQGEIAAGRGRQALDDLVALPIFRYPHEPFLARTWELRHSLSAYDAA